MVDRPDVELTARACPPIRVVQRLRAREVSRPAAGVRVFDLGVNVAGWPLLDIDTAAGQAVHLRPAEQLTPDGRARQDDQTTGAPIVDTYLTRAGRQRWHPQFTYHGFRYLEVTGLPDDAGPAPVHALVLRAANEPIGSLHTSHDLLNRIHRIVDRAVQSNMFSVLTDCPHREKLCWLEETHLVFDGVARGYHVPAYLRELARNMAEAQTATGLVPSTAPEYTVFEDRFRDDPNWGSAIIMLPWLLYREYGDLDTARQLFPAMRRYLGHLAGRSVADTLQHGLGDWIAVDESTPVGLAATWGYHRAAVTMARIAGALGVDARDYQRLAARIARAFHHRFFDPASTGYGSGSQAGDAFALDLDAVPVRLRQPTLDRLVAGIRSAGHHLTVGEIGLPAVLSVLARAGRHDVLYRLFTQTTPPSYGHQVLAGATSLAEAWDGPTRGMSQNHFMLGAVETWLGRCLGGVDQAEDSAGYRRLVLAPVVPPELTSMTYRTRIPFGDVQVAWRRCDGRLLLDVTVPVGATATVRVPTPDGREPVCDDGGLRPAARTGAATEYHVGAGRWRFAAGGAGPRAAAYEQSGGTACQDR